MNYVRSGLSNYRAVAVQKINAEATARQYPSFYADNGNTPVKILGQEWTLNRATEFGNANDVRAVIAELDRLHITQYEKQNGTNYPGGGLLSLTRYHEIKENAVSNILRTQTQLKTRRSFEKRFDDDLLILNGELTNVGLGKRYAADWQATQSWIESLAGSNPTRSQRVQAADRAINALIHGAANGTIHPDVLQNLLDSPILPEGSKKQKIWGNHFHRHRPKLEAAINNSWNIRLAKTESASLRI